MGIEQLLTALLEAARRRVRNGQITERSLARLTGVSQPHLHHILKGKRGLTPTLADRMMEVLALDLAALMELGHAETVTAVPQRSSSPHSASLSTSANPASPVVETVPPIHEPPVLVPFLDGLIGPGHPRPVPFRQPRYLPVPRRELPVDVALLAARIAVDPQAGPTFVPNDLIVIAATPFPAMYTGAMPELSWVLEEAGTWRVEPPPHPGWKSAPDAAPAVPAQRTPAPAVQLDLDLLDGEYPRQPDAASAGESLVGVVVLCIRRMGPMRLPLLDAGLPGG